MSDASASDGWYSRGYLPHFDQPGLTQVITFRLGDSLPAEVYVEWELLCDRASDAQRRERLDEYLDAGYGACHLRDPRMAKVVEDALLHFDGRRYKLLAWVVMPNHVHVIIEMPGLGAPASSRREMTPPRHAGKMPAFPGLARIIHSWNSYTSTQANLILGCGGAFWQREYYDRVVRDQRHLRRAIEYIHNNPVKAGLVQRPEEWQFSSAWEGRLLGGV